MLQNSERDKTRGRNRAWSNCNDMTYLCEAYSKLSTFLPDVKWLAFFTNAYQMSRTNHQNMIQTDLIGLGVRGSKINIKDQNICDIAEIPLCICIADGFQLFDQKSTIKITR